MNDDLSDFLKLAYKSGRVKDVSEAFKEFPVENEWHKGNPELVLNEDSEVYNSYSIGDIVFVKEYYYENGQKGNNHMFVIIDQNNVVVPIEHFGMLISSQLNKLKFNTNKPINKSPDNGLKKDSLVKTDIIYKISNNQILFKVGKIDEERIQEYKQSYLDFSKNNN